MTDKPAPSSGASRTETPEIPCPQCGEPTRPYFENPTKLRICMNNDCSNDQAFAPQTPLPAGGAKEGTPDQPSRLDIVESALAARTMDVKGLEEDIALLLKVVYAAESAVVTVRNEVAQDRLRKALDDLPRRLKSEGRHRAPLIPSPAKGEEKQI